VNAWTKFTLLGLAAALIPACGSGGASDGSGGGAAGPPAVTSLYPLGAPTGGKVRVSGSNCANVTDVRIGAVSCPFTVEGPGSLVPTVPAAADTGKVTVTTLLGSSTSAGNLRVVTPAKVNAAMQLHAANSGTGLVLLYEFPGEPTLVFHESYQTGNASTARLVASATKTLNGILLAAALDDGIVHGLHEQVSDVITEWKSDPLKAQVTLDHLVTLSSGLVSGGTLGGMNFAEAINQPLSSATVANGVGTDFEYGADPFQVLGLYLIRRMGLQDNPTALGGTKSNQFQYGDAALPMAMAYLKSRVNAQAGLWKWSAINTTPNQQDPGMGGGALFTTMEFARMGQFLLNRGAQTFGGTQIISPQFIDLISTPSAYADPTPTNATNGYGHAAWIGYGGATPDAGTPPTGLYSAAGAGKNMAWVLPPFRMAMGRHALVPAGQSMNEHEFFVALGLTE